MTKNGTVSSKTLAWKGLKWLVKAYSGSPGGNRYVLPNVFIDVNNQLHLIVQKDAVGWTCASLQTTTKMKYGTYRAVVQGRLDLLDKNVIFGMFNYGGVDYINEIDIEVAYWGDPSYGPIGYTSYPPTIKNKVFNEAFPIKQLSNMTTHKFTWLSDGVVFLSQQGEKASGDNSESIASCHTSTSPNVAMPFYFDLWLMDHKAPSNNLPTEVVIKDFSFTPL